MTRPRKWKNVCCLPPVREFGPLDPASADAGVVRMDVEEYETIRLIDHLGMTQEECAERMGVARTTVQSIYSEARRKVARSLVEGLPLIIDGGRYRLCEHGEVCRKHRACRRLQGAPR
ncbi:MAG: DUF134 domain-containing protein [Euryarchaeota archaeon]|jgi:predicted DNA-binding protein (UPF0251 family)|nr:DUF134 domain-containing protein [Euryarchaeota archaeon]